MQHSPKFGRLHIAISILTVLALGSMVLGTSSAASYTLSGAYTVDGTTATQAGASYSSSTEDGSGVYVLNGGALTLTDATVVTTGDTSSMDDSSFYGLNAGVLATSGSTITMTGGSVTTSGTGGNGVFSTGTGTTVYLTNVTISATAQGGHGVDATLGGTLVLTNVDIATAGANGAAIATDRGGGTITVTGGSIVTSGADSPGIYSTGSIAVTGATISATGAEAAVVEGANSITLTDVTLSGEKKNGVMLYQSMSGDASTGTASFTMAGGSLSTTAGAAFYVTNTNAAIVLKDGTTVTSSSGVLLSAAADKWGTSGSNGGVVTLYADNETLTGNVSSDDISTIAIVLTNGTTYSGAIDSAAVSLDATSTWNVSGDSIITTLSDASGISGSSITNIIGNGHTVYYDSSLSANSALGGLTYTLMNGGTLAPLTASGSGSDDATGGSTNDTAAGSSTGYITPIAIAAVAIAVVAVVAAIVKRRK